MFRKLPDKKKINNNSNNNNYSSQYQKDNNEFVYIDNVNQVLDLRRLSIDTGSTSNGIRINNNMNNQYQHNSRYDGGETSVNYGSYSSYSMQVNYINGYESNNLSGYDMNDNYNNGYSNSNGVIVNENKENTISEWILYNNRQEFYNRVDNNQSYNNEYQNGEGKYYNYSSYSSSNSYLKNNFQQIPNSGIQYSGIVNERQSIPYYETLPIPIYTSNTIKNNDESLSEQAIYDDNTNTIQEKYTLTSKPETTYSMSNTILTSSNSYLYNKNNNSTSGYYQTDETKPIAIISNANNDDDDDGKYDNYNGSTTTPTTANNNNSMSKPLLNTYSNNSNYINNTYISTSNTTTTATASYSNYEHKKRVSISSRSNTSQNYPMVITTSLQSNLNSRYPYSTVVDSSSSPLTKQRYNYDYQYQRSVPSTSYYDGLANDSNENGNNTDEDENKSENSKDENSDNGKINNNKEENNNETNNNNSKEEGKINGINKEDEKSNNGNNNNDNDNNDNNNDNNEKIGLDKKEKEGRVTNYKTSSSSPTTTTTNKLKKNERYSNSKQNSYKHSSFFSQVIESNNFKCPWPDCDQSFASVTLLNAHEIYSHGTPYPPYPLPQPTYAELADARHRILWHIKNNISTNPLNFYNSNYCSSVQSPNSSVYSNDSPYSHNSTKISLSANSYKSSESSNTFTERKRSSLTKSSLDDLKNNKKSPKNEKNDNTKTDDNENENKNKNEDDIENKNDDDDNNNENENQSSENNDIEKESHIIKKISKIKNDVPHLNIDNIKLTNQNKTSPEGRNDSSKYTQSLSSSSTAMQSLRVQIKVDIKEHLFHYLFTPYIRYSHYTKSYSCFFEGVQGRSIVGEILEDPDWDIRCEDEYSVSYIKMDEGSREAGILFSWERKKVDEWFPSTEDENERPSLYNDIVTINFVVACTKKR
ncbi:hypothetical protein BCR32DRAFT_324673 [Anaeromyces robustus]|uniref:C2H2-type domain-containing protein n=1 Tax=Anaeromyces robustus TaxID=1754192 RepID=A0A1Y1XMJ4_9FUNG|nr:hypothetical protein BCR32DRAFT_324673 [Anaeromyces robustus]|eukprot:ORX86952.1 hypothetical protein BCR32DRAFT_324673 [Anaeromyces robustus]